MAYQSVRTGFIPRQRAVPDEDVMVTSRQLGAAPMGNAGQVSPFTSNPYMVVNYGKASNDPSYDNTMNLDPTKMYQLVDQKTGQVLTSDPTDPTSLARLVLKANQLSGYAPTRASWDIMEGTPGEGGTTWGPSIASDRPNRSFLNQMLPYLGLALGAVGTGGLLGLLGAPAAAGSGALASGLGSIGAGISSAGAGLGSAGLGALAAGSGALGTSALGSTAVGAGGAGLGLGGTATGLGAGATGAGAGLAGAAGAGAGGLGGLGSLAGAAGSAAGSMAPITVVGGATGAGGGLGALSPALGGLAAGAGAAGSGISNANPGQEQSWEDKLSRYLELGGYGASLLGSIFGGGGQSGGGTYSPGSLNPIFSAQLPAANLPGGNNRSPRVMPQQDWTQYAFGPEQSFYNNVPQPAGYAEGGDVRPGKSGEHYVDGPGTGRSDDIPALLSDGEYVIDAETVALLGDGSSKAGADKLDQFRVNIRKHKAKHLAKGKMSKNAKRPEKYLAGGSK